jgi:hypothetical protein
MCNEKKLDFFDALFQIIGLPLQPILKNTTHLWQKI